MSPEPEKRSEAVVFSDLLTLIDSQRGTYESDGAFMRLRGAFAAQAAALAASRADNERLRAERRDVTLRLGVDRDNERAHRRNAESALAAARVEVSQLRAKLEALDESLALDGYASDHRWRRLLAEPLGSTEDPPATEENR